MPIVLPFKGMQRETTPLKVQKSHLSLDVISNSTFVTGFTTIWPNIWRQGRSLPKQQTSHDSKNLFPVTLKLKTDVKVIGENTFQASI